jgi:hypothetical protein
VLVVANALLLLLAAVALASVMDLFDPAAAGAAEAAELVMAYTTSRTPVSTGEPFTLTARIENQGPNAAANPVSGSGRVAPGSARPAARAAPAGSARASLRSSGWLKGARQRRRHQARPTPLASPAQAKGSL